MDELIRQAHELLKDRNFDYAVCGGYAIDLFLGCRTRAHGDIDICVFEEDCGEVISYMQSLDFKVYEMVEGYKCHQITAPDRRLGLDRNVFCVHESCRFLSFAETDEKDYYILGIEHAEQTELNFVDFFVNNRTDVDFLYPDNHDIKIPMEKAILFRDGVPYLAPEICLLCKAGESRREEYQQDYEMTLAGMSPDQQSWLRGALMKLYPDGHRWIG